MTCRSRGDQWRVRRHPWPSSLFAEPWRAWSEIREHYRQVLLPQLLRSPVPVRSAVRAIGLFAGAHANLDRDVRDDGRHDDCDLRWPRAASPEALRRRPVQLQRGRLRAVLRIPVEGEMWGPRLSALNRHDLRR